LPHHVKFRVTGDVSGPVELDVGSASPESPDEQAVRARAATAATAAVFQMVRFIVVEPPCSGCESAFRTVGEASRGCQRISLNRYKGVVLGFPVSHSTQPDALSGGVGSG
jgi:hypothetical protein